MPANNLPKMPEPDALNVYFHWNTVEGYGRACYLAGIAAARSAVESSERYEASIGGGCECCGTWAEVEADKNGDLLKRDQILTNLSALEQGAGK